MSEGRGLMPIGLEIGAAMVHAAQVSYRGSEVRVEAGVEFARAVPGAPACHEDIERFRDAAWRAGLRGERIVLAAPEPMLRSAMLELPSRESGAPVDQIARSEVARLFRFGSEGFEIHAWELPFRAARPGASATTQMAVTSLRHAEGLALDDMFSDAGYAIEALDIGASASARVAARAFADGSGLVGLLDAGWSAVRIAVAREGQVVYERSLPDIGIERLRAVVARKLHFDDATAEALVTRVGLGDGTRWGLDAAMGPAVRAVLVEHFEQMLSEVLVSSSYVLDHIEDAAITRLGLTGGGAQIPGLAGHVELVTGIETRTIRATDIARCSPGLGSLAESSSLVGAVGLSARGVL